MPADGMGAAVEKGLRHVPVGSSAIKLPQSRGDAKGRNVAFWHFSAVPTAPSDVRFQGVISTDRRNTF
jgi:hypothetical protein